MTGHPAVRPPVVWVFAGLDPTGGAGVLADTATLTSLGVHAAGIVTLLSGQDSHGIHGWQPLSAEQVRDQALPMRNDLPPAAVKIGAVGTAANARAIAELLDELPNVPLVLDPVLASERGDPLAQDALLTALRDELLPRATLTTPNRPEACRLAGLPLDCASADLVAALLDTGASAVLLTGGHAPSHDGGQVVDLLYRRGDEPLRWTGHRHPYAVHGGGCLLASAITAQLAHGLPLPVAVAQGRAYSATAWAKAWQPADGQHLAGRPTFEDSQS